MKKLTPRVWRVIDGKTHRTAKGSSEETEALLSDWCGYSEPAGNGLYWWYWASNSGSRVCLVNREYRGGPLPAYADKAQAAFLAVWERVKDKPKYAGIQLPVAFREVKK